MKLKIIRSIFCILFFCSCNQNFETLSAKNAENEVLLKKIIPNKTVKYWQIEHFPNYKTDKLDFEILFSKGNTENISIPKSKFNLNGFFSGCHPSLCAYRITYLENDQWKIVRSEKELKTFIDKVDNVYEAYLIGKINEYDIDQNSEEGNGFLKVEDGYTLKMMKYNNCPESKESFTLSVNYDGTLANIKSNGFYYKSTDCIIY